MGMMPVGVSNIVWDWIEKNIDIVTILRPYSLMRETKQLGGARPRAGRPKKQDKKLKCMFVLRPETVEALGRLVPGGDRSEFVDGLICQRLGVERDMMKIIDRKIEKNLEKKVNTN